LTDSLEFSKEQLYQLYWVKGLSQNQIAKMLQISPSKVWRLMKKHNIKRRSFSEARMLMLYSKGKIPKKETLETLYWQQRLSIPEIAKRLHICQPTVLKWMKVYNIPRRPISEATRKPKKWTEEGLKCLKEAHRRATPWWIEKGLPNPAKLKIVREKISRANKGKTPWNKGIPRSEEERRKMSEAIKNHPRRIRRGPRHPLWKGGRYPYYGEDWYQKRRLALERDHYSCRICGSTKTLHVHHIIPRRLGGKNELSNLITLCAACHERLEIRKRLGFSTTTEFKEQELKIISETFKEMGYNVSS
jgi:transposase